MRVLTGVVASLLTLVVATHGCTADDSPLEFGSSSGASDAGLDGETDAEVFTCEPSAGATPCDTCVYAECCSEAGACSVGTPCFALWTCARSKGCLDAQASDFDTCVVEACPDEASEPAIAAIEALAGCVRTHCGMTCSN